MSRKWWIVIAVVLVLLVSVFLYMTQPWLEPLHSPSWYLHNTPGQPNLSSPDRFPKPPDATTTPKPTTLSPTQTPVTIPGKSLLESARVLYADSVDLKAGETRLIDVTLETRKDGPGEFSCVIFRTDKEYGKDTLPMPRGLEVSIEPPKVMASPNNTYHLTITIKTTPDIALGEYWLRFEQDFENVFRATGWIRVKIG